MQGFRITTARDPEGHTYDNMVDQLVTSDNSFSFSIEKEGSGIVTDWSNSIMKSYENMLDHDARDLYFATFRNCKGDGQGRRFKHYLQLQLQ